MKAIIPFIFIIFIGASAMAQEARQEVKVVTHAASVTLNIHIDQNNMQQQKVARLYMFKNSRIKKALKFKTKRNASKIA